MLELSPNPSPQVPAEGQPCKPAFRNIVTPALLVLFSTAHNHDTAVCRVFRKGEALPLENDVSHLCDRPRVSRHRFIPLDG